MRIERISVKRIPSYISPEPFIPETFVASCLAGPATLGPMWFHLSVTHLDYVIAARSRSLA